MTELLVGISSGPSPCAGERRCADVVERWARNVRVAGVAGAPFRVESRSLAGDRHGRRNLLLTVPGRGPRGVLFCAHLDTVGTLDFGPLKRFALDPAALERRRPAGPRWMQGRGTLDMKSGIAAAVTAMLGMARIPERDRPGPVGLLITPDEENASAGMHALAGWKALRGRRWALAISTDFVPPPPAGFNGWLLRGTVGKALAGVLLRTPPAHAAERRAGPDAARWAARLIQRMGELAGAGNQPGPRVLRARDLKSVYDTQLPERFVVYFNVLGYPLSPERVLRELRQAVRASWRDIGAKPLPERAVRVARRGEARPAAGQEPWDAALDAVERAGGSTPGATVYFSLPYYASRRGPNPSAAAASALQRVARAHGLATGEPYPYISDLSFLGPVSDPAARAWRAACPIRSPAPGAGLQLPLYTLGPWGRGAHGPDEAVRSDYAFGALPGILEACVREFWAR